MTQILAVVFGLSFLVIVHEAGHYLVARAYGMRVLRFSIGLGPPIAKWQPKGSPTVFQVAAIPFLAYVQIDGMNPFEEIDRSDPALFPNKSVWARFATLFAGSAFNYVAASLLFFVLFTVGGVPINNVVGGVEPGLPAAEAGLVAGDIVDEVNGTTVGSFAELQAIVRGRGDQPTVFVVHRGDERLELTVTPRTVEVPGTTTRAVRIGVSAGVAYQDATLSQAGFLSVVYPLLMVRAQFEGLAMLIRNPDPAALSSVVDMGASMAEAINEGWQWYLSLVAGISVALAVFNLLPIPALDGGRIMFVLYEAITRRRPNERFEAVVHTAGLLVLLALVLAVNARSIYVRWISPPAPAAETTPAAPAAPSEPAPSEPAPPPGSGAAPAAHPAPAELVAPAPATAPPAEPAAAPTTP